MNYVARQNTHKTIDLTLISSSDLIAEMKGKLFSFLLIAPLFLTGCASIIDGGPETVQINSNPEGAKVTIFNKLGKEVTVQTTPTMITLERSYGFARAEEYKLIFEEPGYYPYETHIQSILDGWYVGNVIFGGVIGCVVDLGTGDCYTLSPMEINQDMISTNQPELPPGVPVPVPVAPVPLTPPITTRNLGF